jgi:hypothetical protein
MSKQINSGIYEKLVVKNENSTSETKIMLFEINFFLTAVLLSIIQKAAPFETAC